MFFNKRDAVIVFMMVWILILSGCNGSSDSNAGLEDKGALSLKIKWETNDSERIKSPVQTPAAPFDCNSYGVATLEIVIFDSSGTEIFREDSWKCSEHKGTIKGISQKKVSILLLAKDDSGDVVYRGMQENVGIDHGKNNKVRITALPFTPELLSPMQKSCATHPVLEWQKVKGAAEYHVFISDNKAMDNATTFIEALEQHEILETGNQRSIFWQVQSVDGYGNLSKASDVFNFSINQSLLKDIDPGSASSNPSSFTVIDQTIYFSADVSENGEKLGEELCISNGTTLETQMLKDIHPGHYGSYCGDFINFNGTLIFSAENDIYGTELWKIEKNTTEPVMVKDLLPGDQGSFPKFLIRFKNHIYFLAGTGKFWRELWRTDGTKGGTELFLKSIWVDNLLTVASVPTETGNKDFLFFIGVDDKTGKELWKTNGTVQGTELVKDINSKSSSFISSAIAWNNALFFSADDGVHGFELWKYDGILTGTTLVKDTVPGVESGYPSLPIIMNDKMYFFTDSGLWKTDGTDVGTTVVKTFNSDYGIFFPIIVYKNKLFFSANNGEYGQELWVSDGNLEGTNILKDINKKPEGSHPESISVINDYLYFTADDGIHGRELWRSDGTSSGTFMKKDIWPGKYSGNPNNFKQVGSTGSYVFSARNGTNGREIWISEGLDENIQLLKDLNTVKSDNPPNELTLMNDILYFTAASNSSGIELWRSDFTKTGTQIVRDINPIYSSTPRDLTVMNQTLYFFARDETHIGLWKSDGSGKSTSCVHQFKTLKRDAFPSDLTVVNNLLFFIVDETTHGRELWKSDGTTNGTSSMNLAPYTDGSHPYALTPLGDQLFFIAHDENKKNVIWFTDGSYENTVKTTFIPKTINDLVSIENESVYFLANDGTNEGLWQLKPKNKKEYEIGLIDPDARISLTGLKDQLFYLTSTATDQIRVMDGHSQISADIKLANRRIYQIGNFTKSEIGYYFILETRGKRFDLWFTDGTADGTYLIKEELDRAHSIMEEQVVTFGKHLFFKTYDKAHGYELWTSDGTAQGTRMIWDIYDGVENGNPRELTIYNNTLYFTSYDKESGGEIRSICLDSYLE